MSTKPMKALIPVWYAGREYQPGETITPECDLDGRSLAILWQAEYAAEDEPKPPPPQAATKPVPPVEPE